MHFIIIGAGDVGVSLAERLTSNNHNVVLIERNEQNIGKIHNSIDLQIIIGNGCAPENLLKAGLEKADYLISVTDIDEVNIATCLIAKLLSPQVRRVARLREIELTNNLINQHQRAEYFDLIINPDQAGADYLFQLFQFPGAIDLAEFAKGKVRVVGLKVQPDSELAGNRMDNLRGADSKLPLLVIALIRDGKLIVPKGTDRIRADDIVYTISTPDKTKDIFKMTGHKLIDASSACIWGGTPLARFLAHRLEDHGTKVKLILAEIEDRPEIADEFKDVLLLEGAGTDQNLLIEENISDIDTFVAASPHQEDNILAALLAKKLGVRTVMALVNNSTYLPLVSTIGVDVVVSTQLAAASTIFEHVHSESVISEFSLRQQPASFIEIEIHHDFPLLGQKLKDIKLPHGSLIAAIVRAGNVIIPSGDDGFELNDDVIIFIVKSATSRLEKMFNMELDL